MKKNRYPKGKPWSLQCDKQERVDAGEAKSKCPLHQGKMSKDYLKRSCILMSEILFQLLFLNPFFFQNMISNQFRDKGH